MAIIDDLISYWKLDESAGNAIDAHSTHDGTVTGCAYSQAGKINTAYGFDGNDYVTIPASSDFEFDQTESFSISAWINTSYTPRNFVIGHRLGTIIIYVRVFETTGLVNFYVRDADGNNVTVWSTDSVHDGAWHHIVAVFDNATDTAYVYVDGSDDSAAYTPTNKMSDGGTNFYIGVDESLADGMRGTIDEVGIWNRALDSTEVTALYNRP
ncbi:unnamed protein product [marine sediment metagenome]|uniref:LamG-like jellyroll fold domain-containing protein n=1 Tax=marine sediment metagenome TaxID=412755 RepID=X1MR04_9ZZZZ